MSAPLISLFLLSTEAGCSRQAALHTASGDPAGARSDSQAVPPEVQEMMENFQRVRFDYDSSALDGPAQHALAQNARLMKVNPDIGLDVRGLAAEEEPDVYAMALGQRRADAVKAYLTGRGVGPSRVSTLLCGEEQLRVSGRDELVWSGRRQPEYRITWAGQGAPDLIGDPSMPGGDSNDRAY